MSLFLKIVSLITGFFVSQSSKLDNPVRRELREISRLGQNLIVMEMGR